MEECSGNLKRCIVKRDSMSKSGAAVHTLPKCKYFNQLQFLQQKETNQETESNFNNSTNNLPETDFSVPASPGSSIASFDKPRLNQQPTTQQL